MSDHRAFMVRAFNLGVCAQEDRTSDTDYDARLEELMVAADQAASTEEAPTQDAARLDFLAEITNLSVLRDFGRMLKGAEVAKIATTADALSRLYEVHRRTKDTPAAFRAAVDDAMRLDGPSRKG